MTLCVLIVQMVLVSFTEHNYYGDSDLEVLESSEDMDESLDPEASKSMTTSNVS